MVIHTLTRNHGSGIAVKKDDCCGNIKINIVHEYHDQLSNMELNTTDVIFIDGLFVKLSNLFVTAAKHTFGTMKPEYRNTRKHTQCKPGFTKECISAKRNYQKAKRLFKKYGSSIFKNHLTKTESSYKKTPDKSLRKYRINMKNKLKRPPKCKERLRWSWVFDEIYPIFYV